MRNIGIMISGLLLTVGICSAEVVFEENFESAADYGNSWPEHGGWSLVAANIHGKKSKVLDIKGGQAGLGASVFNFRNFDFEADFRIVKGWGGFILRARDDRNFHMMQFGAGVNYVSPHTRKHGQWSFERLPLSAPMPAGQWRHVKFEVRGVKFRCYLGPSANQMKLVGEWKGKEAFSPGRIGFRCANREHIQVDNIRISTDEPITARLAASRPLVPRAIFAARPFDLRVDVRNVGWETPENASAALVLPKGVVLVEGRAAQSSGELKPGAARRFSWKVRADRAVAGKAVVNVRYDGLAKPLTIQCPLIAHEPLPQTPSGAPSGAVAEMDARKNVVLANRRLRLLLAKGPKGYSAAVLYVYDGKQYKQVAVSLPLGHFAYRTTGGQAAERDVVLSVCEIKSPKGRPVRVTLKGHDTDEDGCRWDFSFTYQLDLQAKMVLADYRCRTDRDRSLLYFQGPDLYAGDGSFGSRKKQALFGGLEWLDGRERSSSDRDMVPAIANRYAPHPYKVCMPVMAVAADDGLVGLMWDPLQKWDGKRHKISARFASPNWKDGQENHLMGLFLPSIPDFVPENQDRARKPYPLKVGKEISLKAWIVADADGRLMNIVDHYLAAFGPLKKLVVPEDYAAILKKCRVGYMETMWNRKVVGTKHWDGGPARQFPNACAILWQDAVWAKDPEVRRRQKERVKLIVSKALKTNGAAGLVDPIDTRAFGTLPCHIRGYFLPLHVGHLESGLAAWKERIERECIKTQKADGSWNVAGVDRCRQGKEIVSGTVAELAGSVLMYARVTGDDRALRTGLKAIEFLDKLDVPRGAQVWEVPKYTPDILASGHAIWAYLEAYRITGQRKYLERARYWGKTVFPFVYLWRARDVRLMEYCTIPVFGATFYTGSWFGRPVQWCGLVPGYWLIRLAEFDRSYPWRELGQGIMDNSIHQMLNVWKKYPGTYTDSIGMIDSVVSRCKFEPENIMKPILLMRKTPVEVNTRIVKSGGARIHISTASRLEAAACDAAGKIVSCVVEYPRGEVGYLVIAGITPGAVSKDGSALSRANDLDAVDEGWKVNTDGLLLMKVKHSQKTLRLRIISR